MPIKSVIPSFLDGKRILMRGCENFGPGSYDPCRALHTGVLREGCIIPCRTKIISVVAKEKNGAVIDATTSEQYYNGMILNLYEN